LWLVGARNKRLSESESFNVVRTIDRSLLSGGFAYGSTTAAVKRHGLVWKVEGCCGEEVVRLQLAWRGLCLGGRTMDLLLLAPPVGFYVVSVLDEYRLLQTRQWANSRRFTSPQRTPMALLSSQ